MPSSFNLVFTGQSNADYAYADGAVAQLAATLQQNSGYTVNPIGGIDTTAFAGTPLLQDIATLPPWLEWNPATEMLSDGPYQTTINQTLASLPAAQRAAPTAIVWMHNESDSVTPGLTPELVAAAIRQSIDENRAALGQSAATTPVFFVSIPFNEANDVVNQFLAGGSADVIRQAMQMLIDDPSFNASWGAQIGDSDMNRTEPYNANGGLHLSVSDMTQLMARLAPSISSKIPQFMQTGAANSAVDTTGPAAVSATSVSGNPNQVVVQLNLAPGSSGISALGSAAAEGAGWTAVNGDTTLYATSAALGPNNRLILTFDAPVLADMTLYYGGGAGRIYSQSAPVVTPSGQDQGVGQGSGIYDNNGLLLQATAFGLQVAGAPAVTAGGPYALPVVEGGASGTTITGNSQDAIVTLGNNSNASVYTTAANTTVYDGDNGLTTVFGGNGDLTVKAGTGRMNVYAGSGGSFLYESGLSSGNTIFGGSGTTKMFINGGDFAAAGSGPTTIVISNDGTSSAAANVFGGSGTTVADAIQPVDVNFMAGSGSFTAYDAVGTPFATYWSGAGSQDDSDVFNCNGLDETVGCTGSKVPTTVNCGPQTLLSATVTVFGVVTETPLVGSTGPLTVNVGNDYGTVIVVTNTTYTSINGALPGGTGILQVWEDGTDLTINANASEVFVGGSESPTAKLIVNRGSGDQTVFIRGENATINSDNTVGKGNFTFVQSAGNLNVDASDGANTLWQTAGTATLAGDAGANIIVNDGSGETTVNGDGSGVLTLELMKGAAGGTDILNEFDVGRDQIVLRGYSQQDLSNALDGVVNLGGGMGKFMGIVEAPITALTNVHSYTFG